MTLVPYIYLGLPIFNSRQHTAYQTLFASSGEMEKTPNKVSETLCGVMCCGSGKCSNKCKWSSWFILFDDNLSAKICFCSGFWEI